MNHSICFITLLSVTFACTNVGFNELGGDSLRELAVMSRMFVVVCQLMQKSCVVAHESMSTLMETSATLLMGGLSWLLLLIRRRCMKMG
jgi:hypothetical protein